jgi:hypothetical protein
MYVWGCLGGLAAALVVYVVPVLTHAVLRSDARYARDRAELMTVLVVVLTTVAGVAALMPAHVTRGQAIAYGLTSQAILKGLATGAKEAIPTGGRVR